MSKRAISKSLESVNDLRRFIYVGFVYDFGVLFTNFTVTRIRGFFVTNLRLHRCNISLYGGMFYAANLA